MSWYVDRGNSSQRFYGVIQMKQPELKLFGLVDHSSEFSNAEDTVTSWKTWYGAYYYKLIPVRSARDDYYVLLGWNSNGPGLSGRVIEALHFRSEEHTSELQSLMRLSYAVFCLKNKTILQ